MLSRVLAVPFVLGLLLCVYLAWESDESYAAYIIPQALSLVVIYIFQPQIDWWWYNRRPPEVDHQLRQILDRYLAFYQRLSEGNKKRFRERVALYVFANDFMAKVFDEVPEDIKGIIATNIVQLTFGQSDYRMDTFERIVVYPQPFPSPQYPTKRHASEIFEEDGVILFSAEQLMAGTLNPKKNYNIGLHEYAKIFILTHPKISFPKYDDFIWEKLEMISGFSREFVEAYIGLPDVDPLPVSMTYFICFPVKFKEILPNAYQDFVKILNLNPINQHDPVVDKDLLIEEQKRRKTYA
ncbi:MAG: zinc-dependent peptidase [Bacteroidota bacterium]